MQRKNVFLSILAAIFLAGCSTVISQHPVGAEKYTANPDEWDGIWLSNVEPVTIKVIDQAKGIIRFTWIENNDTEPKIESMIIQVMRGKQWLYANVLKMGVQKSEQGYYWGKIIKENDQIIFWLPSTDAFKTAVESLEIRGSIENTTTPSGGGIIGSAGGSETILLQDKPETIVELVESNGSRFIDWEHPVVLIKLKSDQ